MFYCCGSLRTICVEAGCEASLQNADVPGSADVVPLPGVFIGGKSILDLRRVKDVIIPEGIEMVGNHWFFGSDVESITVSASVREIWVDAFCRCKKLKQVVFAPGNRLERIGRGGFYCTGIERIAIPKEVGEIQEGAFEGCENLKEVVFEEGSKLETIGSSAFYGCMHLRIIAFPEGLKSIEYSSFSYCESLEHIRLPDGLERIGVDCFCYSGLEEVILPASVREVGAQAFYGCEQLRSVRLNEGLEKLGAKETVDGKEFEG